MVAGDQYVYGDALQPADKDAMQLLTQLKARGFTQYELEIAEHILQLVKNKGLPIVEKILQHERQRLEFIRQVELQQT